MSDGYKAKWQLYVEVWVTGDLDASDDVLLADVLSLSLPFQMWIAPA